MIYNSHRLSQQIRTNPILEDHEVVLSLVPLNCVRRFKIHVSHHRLTFFCNTAQNEP